MTKCAFWLTIALLNVSCARAQENTTAPPSGDEFFSVLRKARDLGKANEWARAATLYKGLLVTSPLDGQLWHEYGLLQAKQKQYPEAAKTFEKAFALGTQYPAIAAISAAHMHARAGNQEKALEWIATMVALPYESRPSLADDPAFEPLRNDERFRKLAGMVPLKTEFGRESGWRYDIDAFASEVKRMHYSSWKYHRLPDGFDSGIASLKSRVPQLTDVQIQVELQRLIALLGDGHTRTNFLGQEGLKVADYQFYRFADGLFITAAPDKCKCIGAKVLSVEGRDPADALHAVEPYASHENLMGLLAATPRLIRCPGLLNAIGFSNNAKELTFEIERLKGRETIHAAAQSGLMFHGAMSPVTLLPGRPLPLYLRNPGQAYWLEPLSSDKALYFKFAMVRNQSESDTIATFSTQLGTALRDGRFENLIIDVRLNGGGNLGLLNPLVRELIHFEVSNPKSKIYVITGRETYSAAQVFINDLDYWANPIFAGEPSSSSPNFIGESAPFRLPHSGFSGTISTRFHPTDTMDYRSIIPMAIPVAVRSTDYFEGRDPVLDAVLGVIRKDK